MEPIQNLLHPVVASLLRAVPLSDEKVQCAWQMAVGASLARVTQATLGAGGQLVVVLDDARWRDEIHRSRVLILERLQRVLGEDAVTGLDLRAPRSDSSSRRPRAGRTTAQTKP
jgi:predicted nucleic acid-binding Zn ribbon protein